MRLALPLALLLAACASAPDAPPRFAPNSPLAAVPIENFAEVAPGVYRGAQPDERGFRALKEQLGVKTIVNLRTGGDDEARELGLDVVHLPMASFPSISAPSEERVRAFLDVVNDPARRPVFIHCAQGCDRTGVMCAIYRMDQCGFTAEQALDEMRRMGWHEWAYGGLEECVTCYKPSGAAPTETR
jgi:tyrosine-protein phosphatase SIW14